MKLYQPSQGDAPFPNGRPGTGGYGKLGGYGTPTGATPLPPTGGAPLPTSPAPGSGVTAVPGHLLTESAPGGATTTVPGGIQPLTSPAGGSPASGAAGGLGAAPGGAAQTPFTASNNLIGTQFNPYAAPGASQAQGYLNQAGQALGNLPNLQQSGQDLYQSYVNQANADTGKLLQQAGEQNAAFGRLGSGMQASQIGDIFGQRQAQLQGIGANLANQLAQGQSQQQLAQASGLAGLGNEQYGQAMGNLGFLTGERGYQQGLSQQAYQNALGAAQATAPTGLGASIGSLIGDAGAQQMQQGGNILSQLFAQPAQGTQTGGLSLPAILQLLGGGAQAGG